MDEVPVTEISLFLECSFSKISNISSSSVSKDLSISILEFKELEATNESESLSEGDVLSLD